MRRLFSTLVLATLVLVAGAFFFSRHLASSTPTSTSTSRIAKSALVPPVLGETFALLPCSQDTTLGLEGCAEHRILVLDSRINIWSREVFRHLYDNAARRRFIVAEVDWTAFRRAACLSEADTDEGGSLVAVDFANCVVRLDQQHVSELSALDSGYQGGQASHRVRWVTD